MKIAVTGWKGRVGSQLVDNDCYILDADVTDPVDINTKVELLQPDIVINCAAITDVDSCESDKGYNKALDVNYQGVENVRMACDRVGAALIHLSSDYVFDGNSGMYTEKNRPLTQTNKEPVNKYGWSKLGGEDVLVTAYTIKTLIVRTTGLYGGSEKHDFLKLVQQTVGVGKELKVTEELIGNQTYIPHLIEALLYVCRNLEIIRRYKVLNIASSDIVSRYTFARLIAKTYGYDKSLIIPCKNTDIEHWVAKRPHKAGLGTGVAKRIGVPIYTIQEGLKTCYYKDEANSE